ncbi:MAG: spore photoproduct lyase family protein [Acidimicrobiales bacterium]
MTDRAEFRWRLSGDDGGQPMLFAEEDLVERHIGKGEYRGLEFLHVNAKRVINAVPPSSRMNFRYTINAYRGCSHACKYCFARPTHEYLGLNIGEDFETRLVVKVNAIEKVRAELQSPQWRRDLIAMGTNTDPYQHAEGKYYLTRGIIEVLAKAGNPFSILTKSTLILRDLDLLVSAREHTSVRCNMSIGTLDEDVWKATEPKTPPPIRRLEAVKKLNQAGIPTGVLIAPIIPGWSDDPARLEELTDACLEAGAVSVTPVPLHLRSGTKEHFLGFLDGVRPELGQTLRRRYKGSYLPPAERVRITAPVVRVLQNRATRSPGQESDLTRWDPNPVEEVVSESVKATAVAEQLRLV